MIRKTEHRRTTMLSYKALIVAAVASCSLASPLFAQDTEFQMPEQCAMAAPAGEMPMGKMPQGSGGHGNQAGGMGAMMGMGGMDMETMPEHVQENMRRMMVTMPAMHDGMMNEDADVAFACGMIAHHQGAIDMAQVLLEHGDNPEMIKLAGAIIAAQVGEIEEMTAWLAENAE
ncbi:DUF305 domain-containing protein [Paracoccus sp. T5]|uniref:DUF305 domain-containing protein n=1 Tax=Paracoccus sp. T5 TaxID=3402161 RepID=UPI003AE23EB1